MGYALLALLALFFVAMVRAWTFLLAVPLTVGMWVGAQLIFDSYGDVAGVAFLIGAGLFGVYSWRSGGGSISYRPTGRFGYGPGDIPPPSPKRP